MEPVIELFNLPPEILGIVTFHLHWLSLCRLIMVGNRRLTCNLSQPGGVVKIEVPETLISLPSLFAHFSHLHSFQMAINQNPAQMDTTFRFSSLPKTLRNLSLRGIWMKVDYLNPIDFHVADTFPVLETFGVALTLNRELGDWVATFPSSFLSLEISRIESWCRLPPSLTSLVVNGAIKIDENDISSLESLSKSLSKLVFSSCNQWELLRSFLPSEVTHITCHQDVLSNLSHLRCLKTVTGLSSIGKMGGPFPPLTSFFIRSILNLNECKALPPSLTYLKIFAIHMQSEVEFIYWIASLPRNMLHLHVMQFRTAGKDIKFVNRLDFPPDLLTLAAPRSISFESLALDSIPRSISHLSFFLNPMVDGRYPVWPHLGYLQTTCALDLANLLVFLALQSPNIHTLRVVPAVTWGAVEDNGTIKDLHCHFQEKLQLQMDFHKNPFSGSSQMFKCVHNMLRHFYISECSWISQEILVMLPPTLETMVLEQCPFFDDFTIERHITLFLCLSKLILNRACLTGACFKLLPRSLTTLELNQAEKISNEQIGDLPRSLTDICLNAATMLDDNCGPFIPHRMQRFSMKENETITDHILFLLPTSLWHHHWCIYTSNVFLQNDKRSDVLKQDRFPTIQNN